MNYPIIPHEFAGVEDCWGCLVPKVEGDQVRLVCNECGAVAATITNAQFEAGYVPERLRSDEVTDGHVSALKPPTNPAAGIAGLDKAGSDPRTDPAMAGA